MGLGKQLAESGGSAAATLVLCGLVILFGMLPLLLASSWHVSYALTLEPESNARPLQGGDWKLPEQTFSCVEPVSLANNSISITCNAVESSTGGYGILVNYLQSQGWEEVDNAMELSPVPSPLIVALVVITYAAVGWWAVRRTHGGWGWQRAREIGLWRSSAWVAAPLVGVLVLAQFSQLALSMSSPASALADLNKPSVPWEYLLCGAIPPIVAALPEEALFRGYLHERLFARLPAWLAYIGIAEAFTLVHVGLIVAAFKGATGATFFPVAMVFGGSLLLTHMRRVTGSLLLCVLAHALYNGTVVVGSLLLRQ